MGLQNSTESNMALPPGVAEIGPEGYFVLSSSFPEEVHLRNPICVDASLCRLCRFPIDKKKDKIVTLTPDGQTSSPFIIHYEKYYAPLYIDRALNTSFRHCVYPFCTHNRGLAVAFHAECARLATGFEPNLTKYRSATEYSYQSVESDHERRRKVLRILIENALRVTYGRLSPELWRIVSDDDELIKLYAVAEISLHHRQTEWSIDPSAPVWATYVDIDGVEYVGSLSNSPTTGSRQVWGTTSRSADEVLYISEDNLGIRQVIRDLGTAKPDAAYWQTIPTDNQRLSFRGDGIKLREVLKPSVYPRVFWPCPMTPDELDAMRFYYAGWGEGEPIARMKTFDFNKPGTTAYSVCWAGHEMISIHAHRNDEMSNTYISPWDEEASEYDNRSYFKWTYHPLEQEEFVKQVWLRGPDKYDTTNPLPSLGDGGLRYHLSTPWGLQTYKRPSDTALGLVTNTGRSIVAGSFPDHHGEHTPFSKHREWLPIAATHTNTPMQMFFSPSSHGIPLIAASACSIDNNDPAPKQSPLSSVPHFNPLQALHYSSASLENVVEVRVCKSSSDKDAGIIRHLDLENCRVNETKYNKVTGLLFRYTNGNKASVGCFRLDLAQPPLSTTDTKGLFIGTRPGRIVQIPPHVALVTVTPPEAEGEWTWTELPWSGTLEWWFNPDSLDTSITHVSA